MISMTRCSSRPSPLFLLVLLFAVGVAPSGAQLGLKWASCGNSNTGVCHMPDAGGPTLVRYGVGPHNLYGMVEAVFSLPCDNYVFGDPDLGPPKDCSYAPLADTGSAQWTNCATDGDICDPKIAKGQLRRARYGKAGVVWFHKLIDGQTACLPGFENMTFNVPAPLGGSVGWDPLPHVVKTCQVGDVLDIENKDWVTCASEGSSCAIDPDDEAVILRFGIGDRWTYREIIGPDMMCTLQAMQGDPAPHQVKVCQYAKEEAHIQPGPVGSWEQAGSCVDCPLKQSIEWGVTSASSDSKTESWATAVANQVSAEFKFTDAFKGGASVTVTNSRSTAQAITRSLTRSVGNTCQASCGSEAGNYQLYQWVMDFEEECFLEGTCPFRAYTCNWVCLTNSNDAPRCPVGCCKPGTNCQECDSNCPNPI